MPALSEPTAPIGVFDSGLGGLSVLSAIHTLLPHESLQFCADSRYAPYGERDSAFITKRSLALSRWLIEQKAKALVVACNTATAQVIEAMRARFTVPVIGVEPGVKPAVSISTSRVIGVLATASTLQSKRFQRLLTRHGEGCQFILQPGHGLVDAIERGDTGSSALLESYLAPMLAAGADTLVLGCTHYSFITHAIRRIAGTRLQLIDTGNAVARQVERLLGAANALAPPSALPLMRFCSTGDGTQQQQLLHTLLDIDVTVERVTI